MEQATQNTFLKAIVITVLLSTTGFILLEFNLIPYGFTLFCVTPVINGYIIGRFPNFRITLVFATVLALNAFLYILIVGGLEGWACVVLISPFLFLLLFTGMVIGFYLKKYFGKNKQAGTEDKSLKIYVLPLAILFFSGIIEKFFTEKYTDVRVETKILLPYAPGIVFDYVKSFDTLDSEKPFMFSLGIPRPLKCVLEKDSIGASRTCYFEEGTIDEVVTDFRRGQVLQMKITKYNMPGRKWLHFEDAIYLFKQVGPSTELTRITTYKSELKPRFYWDFMERKAIKAEHDYVLKDLKRRLDEAFKL